MLLLVGILYALSIWPIRLPTVQAFDIDLTQVDIVSANETCIGNLVATVNENPDGDNTISTSFELLSTVEDTCEVCMDILLYSSGDWTTTGISMCKKICEVFDDPVIVGPYVSSLGMDKDKCPPPPGEYRQTDYMPNMEQIPVALPDDDYRLIISLSCGDNTLLSLAVDFSATN